MIGDILTDFSEWEKGGWEVVQVVAPRQDPRGIRLWRVAFVQESRRRVYVCPDSRELVENPPWDGWNEPKPFK